jgi:dTDP-4-dehydrorhamnose reductase
MTARPVRILQYGTIGQLGLSLLRLASPDRFAIDAVTLEEANFANPDSVVRAFDARSGADVVVNAAAYTQVDKAESEEALAHTINAVAVEALARACARRDIPLIHISTDYVFDGSKSAPYVESDPVAPINAYGRTKFAGEEAIRNLLKRHAIIRTSWVYSATGSNFVKTMLRLGTEREELKIVDDQHGAPTSADDLAQAILAVARRFAEDGAKAPRGTFHYTGGGETTWCGIAQAIFDLSARRWGRRPRVIGIPSSAFPTPARRPFNSRLDCSKIRAAFNIDTPPWQESLARVVHTLVDSTKEAAP